MNGSGKTLAAVERFVLPAFAAGRPVLSNTPLFASGDDSELPWFERAAHPLYVPLVSWRQLIQPMQGVTIFLDEISSMFDARESGRMPAQITSRLQQLRKDDLELVWTAPSWERCDIALRRLTRSVLLCRGMLPKREPGKSWSSNRLFRWRFYDASKFEEFSLASAQSSTTGTLRSEWSRWYARGRHSAQWHYDTLAPVDLLDHLDHGGHCVSCGGKRAVPKCSCVGSVVLSGPRRPLSVAEMRASAKEWLTSASDDWVSTVLDDTSGGSPVA